MLSRNFIYSTFILIFFTNTVQAQTQISKHHQFVRSNPIGRILSGDRNKKEGSSIFPGDRINPRSGIVKILCYPNRKMLFLGEGLVDDTADKCVRPKESSKCSTNKRNCSRTKTQPTNRKKPIITNPYGNIILNRRPLISWLPIPESSNYTVILKGHGIHWSEDTTKTRLAYPENKPPLQYGKIYKLDVITNQSGSPTAVDSTILIMTSQQEAQEINDTVKQVQSLNLTPDQEARDLDTIFMSQDLLTQAIQVLQKRIDASTNDPTLHRLLGDRYLQAGFPQKARPLYVKAKSLAQENANKAEQRLAQQGLERSK